MDITERLARLQRQLVATEISINCRAQEIEATNREVWRLLGRYKRARRIARQYMRGARGQQLQAMASARALSQWRGQLRRIEGRVEGLEYSAGADHPDVVRLKQDVFRLRALLTQWAENADPAEHE